jgi:PKD repeat protein
MKKNVTAILILFALASCKRETYVEPISDTPEFVLNGTLDGQPFSLNAGLNGIYMNSSVNQNTFGVYEFTCDFEDLNCNVCEPLISLIIVDDQTYEIGASTSAEVFNQGEIFPAIEENSSDYLTVHFHASNTPGENYEWHFGDGENGFGHSQNHTYDASGVYEVSLDITNGGGPNDDITITQTIFVGSTDLLSVPFEIYNLPDEEWGFGYPNMLPPYLEIENWTVNGDVYFGDNLELEIESSAEVCLHYHHSGLNLNGSYCVVFNGDENFLPNIQIDYNWQAQELNLGKFKLHYRDGLGNHYTSVTPLNTPDTHVLAINTVENYDQPINGKMTKKVFATFDAYLVNEDDPDDVIHFENMQAALGFVIE